jgi:hypothetical protein
VNKEYGIRKLKVEGKIYLNVLVQASRLEFNIDLAAEELVNALNYTDKYDISWYYAQ